jgi:hypothetical protein
MRIGLEFLRTSEHRPAPRLTAQEDPFQALGDFSGNFEQVHQFARAGWTLDLLRATRKVGRAVPVPFRFGARRSFLWSMLGPSSR